VPAAGGEDELVEEIVRSIQREEQVTLLIGSGATASVVPRLAEVLTLAERYADGVGDDGDLAGALEQARTDVGIHSPTIERYVAYRRVFTDWVSGTGFDTVAQQAVLQAFRPADWATSPLATHGIWQPVDAALGEQAENALDSWRLPPGVLAVARLLRHRPDDFGNRILTTNFDPLLEVGIRRLGGRAISVPVDVGGEVRFPVPAEGAVRLYHLHGFWRPTLLQDGQRLLHDPGPLEQPSEDAVTEFAELISGDRVCVVGYSGWDGVVTSALRRVSAERRVPVMWAQHGEENLPLAAERTRLEAKLGDAAVFYEDVDSDRIFTRVADLLELPVAADLATSHHRQRHPGWEFELVSQHESRPPENSLYLLRQLEWRFNWGIEWTGDEQAPTLLFWPVRLRPQASLIHAVQALAAGALAKRGVRLVVCLDDVGLSHRHEYAERFRTAIVRWMRRIDPGVEPGFSSLGDFIDGQSRRSGSTDPEMLLRPVDPWRVAQAFYGQRNPSLYSVLAGMKVVPNVPLHDLERHAATIVRALLSKDANRLLTPLTIWSFLHQVLCAEATPNVMTLGGRDERLFWRQWRDTFHLGVNQLYNPYIKSLTNNSQMISWAGVQYLRQHLVRACRLPGWDQEGRYVPWLLQNGLLLPTYLAEEEPPEVGGYRLDSWASFRAAFEAGAPVLEVLADHVSELFLGLQPS
jgi:hypothetical protein